MTGGEREEVSLLPDILVIVRRSSDIVLGVVREVLSDGSCHIALGSNGDGEIITTLSSAIDLVVPRVYERVKIMGGPYRGSTGKLYGVEYVNSEKVGVVIIDGTKYARIEDMVRLAKLA